MAGLRDAPPMKQKAPAENDDLGNRMEQNPIKLQNMEHWHGGGFIGPLSLISIAKTPF